MTFKDLIKMTYQECDAGVTYHQTLKVLTTAMRICIEELVVRPDLAVINFMGICRFSLKGNIRNTKDIGKGKVISKESVAQAPIVKKFYWELKMDVYQPLKDVFNGKRSIKTLRVGRGIKLYPDTPITAGNRKPIKFTADQTMEFQIGRIQRKKLPQREISIKSRLPEEEDS